MAPHFLCRDTLDVISPGIHRHQDAEASEQQQKQVPWRTEEESGKHLSMTTINKTSPAFVRKNFSRLKNVRPDEMFTNHESLPSLHSAYSSFLGVYPEYVKTMVIDRIREDEYPCLHDSGHVCLDYSGYGLFSQFQQVHEKESASFGMSYTSSNLPSHALYGIPDPGTVEFDIKKRVYEFLNIQDTDYAMVLTSCRESAFKLLAECYPFDAKKRLLSVYDHESDAMKWMEESAKRKCVEIINARFRWPSQQLCTRDLQKKICDKKKKKSSGSGLFVFPLQSSVTGTKYPYQWISEAQKNGWDIFLDASALGPKALSCLGLSVFCPDFIVTSFFKVYSTDPTGFGCLLIKRSAVKGLHSSSAARGVGMVNLIPRYARYDETNNSKSSKEIQEVEEKINCLPAYLLDKGKENVSHVHCGAAETSHEWNVQHTEVHFSNRMSLDQINEETSSTNDVEQDRISSDEEVASTVTGNTPSSIDDAGYKLEGQGSHVQYFSEISEDGPIDIHMTSVPLREHLSALKEDIFYDQKKDFFTDDTCDVDNNYDDTTYLMMIRKEPEIVCKGLNHAETLGFTKTNMRVRCLINWLVSSILKLHHPGSPGPNHLVKIYGPKLSYDRGASVAFNIFDWRKNLIQPLLVQRLADRHNISLGVSTLQHMWYARGSTGNESPPKCAKTEVLTVALGFLSNFEDVYRFWVFLAKFLDADFVSKEVWRYRSLNQETVLLGMQEVRKASLYSKE